MTAARLDRDKIVSEGIALMAEGGLEAVSLRRIAARLAISAPSLYHHFDSKDALFGAMARRIFSACVARVPHCDTWEQWLTEFAHSIWRAQHETRGALQLILASRGSEGEEDEQARDIVVILEKLGLSPAIAQVAQTSIQSLVTGWTMIEPSPHSLDDPDFLRSLRVLIRGWQAEVAEAPMMRPAHP